MEDSLLAAVVGSATSVKDMIAFDDDDDDRKMPSYNGPPTCHSTTETVVMGVDEEAIQQRQQEEEDPCEDQVNNNYHRQMALEALQHTPYDELVSVWNTLAPIYQGDKEFILYTIKHATTLPNKSQFERIFPHDLRSDKDIVLAFTGRTDFIDLYKERHLYVPACLTDDKEVMIAYCQQIPRSLQECSESLCDDEDVVTAAITLDGLELQYASARLQEQMDIVQLACQHDGRALAFCPPGPTRDALASNRDFMLQIVRQPHGGSMLRYVSDSLRYDYELVLQALKHGMRLRSCPYMYQNNPTFLLEAIQRRSEIYLELSKAAQSDPNTAQQAIMSPTSTPVVHQRVLELVPELKQNRLVILSIAQRGDIELLTSLLDPHDERVNNDGNNHHDQGINFAGLQLPTIVLPPRVGGSSFCGDREIMLIAVERKPSLFQLCHTHLQTDVDIIKAAIQPDTALDVMKNLSQELKIQYPQLICHAIDVISTRDLRHIRTYIPEELWSQRSMALSWIQRGGRILDPFEPMLTSDEEIALAVAKHNWRQFNRVGEALRTNMSFIQKAIDLDGRIIRFVPLPLSRNQDLIIRAIASHPEAIFEQHHFRMSRPDAKKYVEDKLALRDLFVQQFLTGIAINRPHIPPAKRSPLGLLDRGIETSQAFKQLVAEFVGVPIGSELRILRRALTNLNQVASSSLSSQWTATASTAFVHRTETATTVAAAAAMRLAPRERETLLGGAHHPNIAPHQPHQANNNNVGAHMDHLERRRIMRRRIREQMQLFWRHNLDEDDDFFHDIAADDNHNMGVLTRQQIWGNEPFRPDFGLEWGPPQHEAWDRANPPNDHWLPNENQLVVGGPQQGYDRIANAPLAQDVHRHLMHQQHMLRMARDRRRHGQQQPRLPNVTQQPLIRRPPPSAAVQLQERLQQPPGRRYEPFRHFNPVGLQPDPPNNIGDRHLHHHEDVFDVLDINLLVDPLPPLFDDTGLDILRDPIEDDDDDDYSAF